MTLGRAIVAIDCFCVREPVKGVARIGRNFVRTLETAPPAWSFVLLGVQGPAWATIPTPANAKLDLWPKAVSRTSWYRMVLPRLLRRARPDMVHGLTDFLPRLRGVPGVVTVTEDPARRLGESGFITRLRRYEVLLSFRASLRRSASALTISRSVAEDLSARYGYSSQRVRVSYPGVDLDLLNAVPIDPGLGRYFMCFATGDDRERWPLVLEAFREVRRSDSDIALAVIGGAASAAADGVPPGVVPLGRVSDDQLAGLYLGALGLVDVATFEGFGLQVLEACHFGTPVLASELPTVVEIAGDTAITHPHPHVSWLAESMMAVAADRQRFTTTPRLATTWDGFAHATWSAYTDAVARTGSRRAD